jgi:hypothetical protein
LQFIETTLECIQILFRCQPADIQQGNILFPEAPTLAQCLLALGGAEQLAVDAAREQLQALEMPALKLYTLTGAGHQGQRRAVVEAAQVVGQRTGKQGQAMLAQVLLEIGMKAGDCGDAQAPGYP